MNELFIYLFNTWMNECMKEGRKEGMKEGMLLYYVEFLYDEDWWECFDLTRQICNIWSMLREIWCAMMYFKKIIEDLIVE